MILEWAYDRLHAGGFRIAAIVDHVLALVREELETPKADPPVASGVPASASGLHVLLAAAVLLGVIKDDVIPDALVGRVADERVRMRIEAHLGRSGLTDGDLRALGDATGLFVSRCMTFDGIDPFEPVNGDIVSVLRLGRNHQGARTELRYALLLDRRRDRVKLADPAGKGIVEMGVGEVDAAWKLGAAGGRGWLGTMSPARA